MQEQIVLDRSYIPNTQYNYHVIWYQIQLFTLLYSIGNTNYSLHVNLAIIIYNSNLNNNT